MPARPPHLLRGLLLALCLAAPATAQRQPLLDLGSAPQAPAAGQGAGALALAEDLRKQAADLSRTDADRARGAVRRFAQTLLTTGEAAGVAGSQRILISRTIARGLSQIDRAITALGPETGDAVAALTARDLDRGIQLLRDDAADPWLVTRDAFAQLARTVQPATLGDYGWITAAPLHDGTLAPDVDAWCVAPGVPPGTDAALKDLEALTQSALGWASYRNSARHTRAAVRDAAALLIAPPAWLPESARRAAGEQFGHAISALTAEAPAARVAALASLYRLAHLSALCAKLDAFDESPALKRIRAELAKTIEQPASSATSPTPPGPATPAPPAKPPAALSGPDSLLAFERALDLAVTRLPDEKNLVRQARPPFRTFAASLRASQLKLLQALPDILARADAMTDPGITATIAAHRRTVQDVQALIALSAAMSDADAKGEPNVAGPWKLAADRLFKLGQDLSKLATHDESLTALREFATQAQDFTTLPGEASLRDYVHATQANAGQPGPASAWSILTGDRAAALLSEVADRRGTWLSGWDRAGYAGSPAEVTRLRALRELMTLLDEASVITPVPRAASTGASGTPSAPSTVPAAGPRGIPSDLSTDGEWTPQYAALQSWPGWDLSPEAFALLTAGLPEDLAEATRLITTGDAAACAALLARTRKSHAAALLAARLARDLTGVRAAASTQPSQPDTTPETLLEFAAGGPFPIDWESNQLSRIAEICRYSEEALTARKLGAKDRAQSLLSYVNSQRGE